MKREQLDRAFGSTPDEFSARISQTLLNLKEEKPVKRFTLRAALITALLIALLCGIAYAAFTQGMDWYYNNRFTAYQQYEPDKYQAIMKNRQTVSVQNGLSDDLVSVTVQETAWVPEKQFLSIVLSAEPKDKSSYELHPMWNLDTDGSYIGEGGEEQPASDGIDRSVHWLWTEKGFGPVHEVMSDPGKQLVLFEASDAYLGEAENHLPLMGDGSSCDSFVAETGEVVTVLEIQIAPEAAAQLESTDGEATIRIPYVVTLYGGNSEKRWVSFEMPVP